MILSISLGAWDRDEKSDGGSLLATPYGFGLACEEALTKYAKDLDFLQESRNISIATFSDAGNATRCAQASLSQGGSRGEIGIVGNVPVPGGEVPLTVMMGTVIQASPFAGANNGSEIDIWYTSQIAADRSRLDEYRDLLDPNKPYAGYDVIMLTFTDEAQRQREDAVFEKVFGHRQLAPAHTATVDVHHKVFSKFVVRANPEDLTPQNLRDLGTYIIDADGNVIGGYLQGTFKTREDVEREVLSKGYSIAFSFGSHRISRDLLLKLDEYFRGRLANRTTAGIVPVEAADVAQILIRHFNGVTPEEIVRSLKGEKGDNAKKNAEIDQYRQFTDDVIAFAAKEGIKKGWMGAVDIGSVDWWRFRRPAELFQTKMLMIADLAGQAVDIDTRGVFSKIDSELTPEKYSKACEEAKTMRAFNRVDHPISNCTLGTVYINSQGIRSDTGAQVTFEDIINGVNIGDVYIKSSIVQDSVLSAGSVIVNSVIDKSRGLMRSDTSYVGNSRVSNLSAGRALVFNLVDSNEEPLEYRETAVSDIFGTNIHDPNFVDGQTRMVVGFGVDGKNEETTLLPGNMFTFRQIRDTLDPLEMSLQIRAEIEGELQRRADEELTSEPRRGPPSGESFDVPSKKAPGTDDLDSAERRSLEDFAERLKQQGKSVVREVPGEALDLLRDELGVEAPKGGRELASPKESFYYYLRNGQIKFAVDDLSEHQDQYLYPRFNANIGVLSFITYGTENGRIICYVHVAKAVWDDYLAAAGADIKNHFIAQMLSHEWTENFMPSFKGLTCHSYACIMETRLLSAAAKEKGVSDLDLFFLEHAARTNNLPYLTGILARYDVNRDPTLGAFYEAIWDACDRYGIHLSVPRMAMDGFALRKDLLTKKSPGSDELTGEEYSMLAELSRDMNAITPIADRARPVPAEVIALINEKKVGKMYDKLLDLINEGKLVIALDDLTNPGLDTYGITNPYFYPRLNGEAIGVLSYIEPTDDRYYIHIPKHFWDAYGKNPLIVAQLLTHLYIQNFLPHIEGFSRHSWATLQMLKFSSPEAIKKGVADIDLLFLETAKRKENIETLYNILAAYQIFKDPEGGFRNAIYEILAKFEQDLGESALLEQIKTGRQLLAWYGYQFETKEPAVGQGKVKRISALLERYKDVNKVIAQNLEMANNKYLFKIRHAETGQMLYFPQNIGAMMGLSDEGGRVLLREAGDQRRLDGLMSAHRGLVDQRNALREQRRNSVDTVERDRLLEIIRSLNVQIDGITEEIAREYDRSFIERCVEEAREYRKTKEKGCIVVGIYGPSSAGKTTLTSLMINEMRDGLGGVNVNYVSADSYLYPGPGWRYEKTEGGRVTRLKGQPIYNRKKLARDRST